MKRLFAAAGALLLAGTAFSAQAAVTVVGKSAARSCYEAARDHRTSLSALNLCDKAVDESMTHDKVASHVNRGILRMLRGDHSAALADYDAAIALDPDEPESFLNKGLLMLRMQGREAETVALVNTALAKKTKEAAIAYYARGIAHEETGNLQAAYRDYQRAARMAPKWDLPAEDLKRFVVRRNPRGGGLLLRLD